MLFAKLHQEIGSFTHLGPKTLTSLTGTYESLQLYSCTNKRTCLFLIYLFIQQRFMPLLTLYLLCKQKGLELNNKNNKLAAG